MRGNRLAASAAGIAGAVLLGVYFTAPAALGWPYAGATADVLVSYAQAHDVLFYAGAWLQVTGTLLIALFFLTVIVSARSVDQLDGLAAIVGIAVLLATVVTEAALLVAVPVAAASRDAATVATTFALSNGVFVRIFPLAPAPLTLVGIGATAIRTGALPRAVGIAAIALGLGFVGAGLLAVASPVGIVACVVLSVVQAVWVLVAAVAYVRHPNRLDG